MYVCEKVRCRTTRAKIGASQTPDLCVAIALEYETGGLPSSYIIYEGWIWIYCASV